MGPSYKAYRVDIIKFIFTVFFHYHLSSLYPTLPTITTFLSMSMSCFLKPEDNERSPLFYFLEFQTRFVPYFI